MGKMIQTEFKTRQGEIIKEFTGGRAWMGTYVGGELGFCCPDFLGHFPQSLDSKQSKMLTGRSGWYAADLYRVEVTVKLVTGKNGQPIIKKNARAPKQ